MIVITKVVVISEREKEKKVGRVNKNKNGKKKRGRETTRAGFTHRHHVHRPPCIYKFQDKNFIMIIYLYSFFFFTFFLSCI